MSMDQLAEAALGRFGLSPRATATLCNVSENHTYRVEDPEARFWPLLAGAISALGDD